MTQQLTSPITPSLISPQGIGSNLDADTVDGKHASDVLSRANHTGTQPSSTITGTFAPAAISPQGDGSGLNADTVDGLHASQIRGGPFTCRMTGSYCNGDEWCVVGEDNMGRIQPCTTVGLNRMICCK